MSRPDAARLQLGWDIGGAHVKGCLLQGGKLRDIAQWPCPLWQGMEHLDAALGQARSRWSEAWDAGAQHAATMTGEMIDLFDDREQGVAHIADRLAHSLGASLRLFDADAGWRLPQEAGAGWRGIASANWCATARVLAGRIGDAVLVDIGSTTTDVIPLRAGRVIAQGTSDAQRLLTGELVYQRVVRTPLCALGPRVPWRGRSANVMNEFFATTADVYRLTGELDPAHDLYPSADNAAKDAAATRKRLARMIGMDARDASDAEWLVIAQAWRAAQVAELGGQLQRVMAMHALSAEAVVVSAGCGDFLVADVVARAGARLTCRRYGSEVARIAAYAAPSVETAARWAQVCAPSVAVAALLDQEQR